MSHTSNWYEVIRVPPNTLINWTGRYWVYPAEVQVSDWKQSRYATLINEIIKGINIDGPREPNFGLKNFSAGGESYVFPTWVVREHVEPPTNELGEVAP